MTTSFVRVRDEVTPIETKFTTRGRFRHTILPICTSTILVRRSQIYDRLLNPQYTGTRTMNGEIESQKVQTYYQYYHYGLRILSNQIVHYQIVTNSILFIWYLQINLSQDDFLFFHLGTLIIKILVMSTEIHRRPRRSHPNWLETKFYINPDKTYILYIP